MKIKPRPVNFGRAEYMMGQVADLAADKIRESVPLQGFTSEEFNFYGPISKSYRRFGLFVVGSDRWGDDRKIVGD